MIESISVWARGIVIAVIVVTIIEMILPDNKNKKYIKVVIGIYILFCIINPVIGKSINFESFNLDTYFSSESTSNNVSKKEENNDKIQKLFEENMKKQIKKELNSRGYDSENIFIKTDEEYNIVYIEITNIIEYKENERINQVNISIKEKPAKGIAISDKETLINYLSVNYKIDKSNIIIS